MARSSRPPLLLHFDVNKTFIQSDSIQMKTIEDGIREGIAELFWGHKRKGEDGSTRWVWARGKPSCNPPVDEQPTQDAAKGLLNYADFCKVQLKDKAERKVAIKSFRLVDDEDCKVEMNKVLQMALAKMELGEDLRSTPESQRALKEAGLQGQTLVMFPALFHLVARLQREGRVFAILFRSFGTDHETIQTEWNAFCEMRHPVFSKLIKEVGPMDGTVPGVPDRRVHGLHTVYRDAEGPVLLLNTFTNGPEDKPWDEWARRKPRAEFDTRGGREWIQTALANTKKEEGMKQVAAWMKEHLMLQRTAAIKDDWAWWQWNGEQAFAGKLLVVIGGEAPTRQIFFDDNVDHTDARIVDCRDIDGNPVPTKDAMNKLCTKVNPVEALLDEEYFLKKLRLCHGELEEVEEPAEDLAAQLRILKQQVQSLMEENRRMKLQRRIPVQDEAQLRDLLAQAEDMDLEGFGRGGRRSIADLYAELDQGHCWLEQNEEGKICRVFEMVFIKIRCKDLILIESHEQDSDGRIQSRNYLPGVRKGLMEPSFDDALDRWFGSGLPVDLRRLVQMEGPASSTPDAPSQQTQATEAYPIPCKVQMYSASYSFKEEALDAYKELLGKIGLPTGKRFTTTEQDRLGGLAAPAAAAGAVAAPASASQEGGVGGLQKAGEGSITRFWRWDKVATWEATTSQRAKGTTKANIELVCKKLFQGHPRQEVYENLLLQMFETFTAKKLCGGFSGSVVIRVQPYESDGRPGEPCIVKLDDGQAIRDEYLNSVNVFEALPDRAARILGDAVYARNKEGEEFGAMRLELAGACWNVPELAQGSANLLTTVKDLLLYECEHALLVSNSVAGDTRPFGNVNSVLAETFGPGGIVSSLRKGANGVRRADGKEKPSLTWGWYTLKGKDTKYNPLSNHPDFPAGPPMRALYKKYFGTEMPDLKAMVVDTIRPRLEKLANEGKKELCPLIGLAHGDLNAANIMIDALDAVWLIDFATSVELPLFTDMCKFEMASLFEYTAIPITPRQFLELASTREDLWHSMNVGEWVRVDQDIAEALLKLLAKMDPGKLANITQAQLEALIHEVAAVKAPHKQHKIVRSLKARLVVNESETAAAFAYCKAITAALLKGEYVFDSLNVEVPQLEPGGSKTGAHGALSLRFFMELTATVRRFMDREVRSCLREFSSKGEGPDGTQPCDASSLQLWLPILRETYRIPGYRDIAPMHKVWAIYHCQFVAKLVSNILDKIEGLLSDLSSLPITARLREDVFQQRGDRHTTDTHAYFTLEPFSEADSHWIFHHSRESKFFPPNAFHDKVIRRAHNFCPLYKSCAGLFAPVYQVYPSDSLDDPVALSFDTAAALPWKVHLVTSHEASASLLHPVLSDVLGYAGLPTSEGAHQDRPVVVLKSRLLFLTQALLQAHTGQLQGDKGSPLDNFSFQDWSEGLQSSSPEEAPRRSRAQTHGGSGRKAGDLRDQKENTSHSASINIGNTGVGSSLMSRIGTTPAEPFMETLRLDAVAKDDKGQEMLRLSLVLGPAALCYPPGTQLCLETSEGLLEVVVQRLQDGGGYKVVSGEDKAHHDSKLRVHEAAEDNKERELELACSTHVYLRPGHAQRGQKILLAEGRGAWLDAEVLEEPSEATAWRHRLAVAYSHQAQQSAMVRELMTHKESSGTGGHPGDARKPERCEILRRLTGMSCGPAWLSAASYEDEVHKMKNFYRARHSFIIDALSGTRIDVNACAVPTLKGVRGSWAGTFGPTIESPPDSGAGPVLGAKRFQNSVVAESHRLFGRGRSVLLAGCDGAGSVAGSLTGRDIVWPASAAKNRSERQSSGWGTIVTALERYDSAKPSCSPNAFLILGSPGSGKTCLVCRLIMDCLDRQRDLLPVLLSVGDLVRRTPHGDPATIGEVDTHGDPATIGEVDTETVQAWFDKYMRITFGEDSQRYKMLRQAISMHRVLFLFEGLEDAGPLKCLVERLIRDIILDRHMVVVTSRPLLAGQSSLEDLREHIVPFALLHLSDEQKRSIAHTRLAGGIASYDRFIKKMREKQEEEEESGESAPEDVFGNPMMLSMLICYLQPTAQEQLNVANADRQQGAADDREQDGVALTAVYRVAVDVMLQRVQSRQQADRHNKEEKVEQCKRVLEKMAMAMQVQRRLEIEAAEFESMLPEDMRPAFKNFLGAAEAGHAMFLRTSREGNKLEIRFEMRGMQNFFAASDIHNDGGEDLPDLELLLTELVAERAWWFQMLDMLAESWPHKYVKLIESKLEAFEARVPGNSTSKAQEGDSFLHLAARVGHRPAFQLLKLFSEGVQNQLGKRNKEKKTPLHVAAEKGSSQICALMLEHKADIEARDDMECMPLHVAMQHGHFSTARLLLDRSAEASRLAPTSAGRTYRFRSAGNKGDPAERLASQILGLGNGPVPTEQQFKALLEETFVELHYFGTSQTEITDKGRSMGALLSIYWIVANQYEQFVRGQSKESQLTRQSWEYLQDWTRRTVDLTSTAERVGAMLVIAAVQSVGKIKDFKRTFAPGCEEASEALAQVLQHDPILIPSYWKLEQTLQNTIQSALKADFNFGQFLQAENLPASLEVVKKILLRDGENSEKNLGFFLFRIFVSMCGIAGGRSLEGSLFMIDKQYNNFKVGLDVLQYLIKESAVDVYNRFLEARAKGLRLRFPTDKKDKELRAIVRLACLSRAYEPAEGEEVAAAFASLLPEERTMLANFLTADGIKEKGFLLYNAPNLVENAKKNLKIGLASAMRMLLKVYQMAREEYRGSEVQVVTIYVEDLANYAKNCQDVEAFKFLHFEIARPVGPKADSQGSVQLSPWQLETDEKRIEKLSEDAQNLADDIIETKSIKEPQFQRRLQEVFPELSYMSSNTAEVRAVFQETVCALLVLYWLFSDQVEAFTRGQAPENKLTDNSWKKVQGLLEDVLDSLQVLHVALVVVVLRGLGKIPKFRAQLAPKAMDHRQVLAHVLQTCPKVLPSFMGLEVGSRKMVQEILTCNFDFRGFLHAEGLPADLLPLEAMLAGRGEYLNVFLTCVFAEAAGCQGAESLEGSLYMTERNFARFGRGMEALRDLTQEDRKSVQDVYDRLLKDNARACGLDMESSNAESRAVARLACLAQACCEGDRKEVLKAVHELDEKERASLTKHLNADGIQVKPSFVLDGAPAFLEEARKNRAVGLLPAIRILLKIYEAAEKELQGITRPVITIQVRKLATFAKEFSGSTAFQDMPVDLEGSGEAEVFVRPKAWIPVTNPAKLEELKSKSKDLAAQLLSHQAKENDFKSRVGGIFPELSYFHAGVVARRDQTLCAMLAVYWLLSGPNGQYEAFVRNQPHGSQLSRQSWEWIQDCLAKAIRTGGLDLLDATLVLMAIHALGKIKELREELAPGFDAGVHDVALSHILNTRAQVVPSFARLDEKHKRLIMAILSVDFEFEQFLQAENTAANLFLVKKHLQVHADVGFAMFCFRLFAQLCGKLGNRTLKGSEFMTEARFQDLKPGLEALLDLRKQDAVQTYYSFLLLRGSEAMARFASPEHQALSRLLTLGAARDPQVGHIICDAFDQLTHEERTRLTRWLNSDGLQLGQRSHVLCEAPELLRNARANRHVGLLAALRMLLQVQQRCDMESPSSALTKVVVHLQALADWAKDAGPERGDFLRAQLHWRAETDARTEAMFLRVEVVPPDPSGKEQRPADVGAPANGQEAANAAPQGLQGPGSREFEALQRQLEEARAEARRKDAEIERLRAQADQSPEQKAEEPPRGVVLHSATSVGPDLAAAAAGREELRRITALWAEEKRKLLLRRRVAGTEDIAAGWAAEKRALCSRALGGTSAGG